MPDQSVPGLVLLLEDDAADAFLIEDALTRQLPGTRLIRAATRREYLDALAGSPIDLVISDGSLPDCEGIEAFHLAREHDPQPAFILVSGDGRHPDLRELRGLGISDFISKDHLDDLGPAAQRALGRFLGLDPARLPAGLELLTATWPRLAAAADSATILRLSLLAARRLTGADGAAFVLPEGGQCHYTAEDGSAPLPVGSRLPAGDCIAGWAIRQRRPAVVDDVDDEPRLDPAPYRGRSVRSLIVAPVRSDRPRAALMVSWSGRHEADSTDVRLLQALADGTASALAGFDRLEALRTTARECWAELDGLTYAVSHDLRAPIRHLEGFTRILLTDLADRPEPDARLEHSAGRIRDAAVRLREMVNGLLTLSRTARAEVRRQPADLAELARQVALRLDHEAGPDRAGPVEFVVPDRLPVSADPKLLQVALQGLLANAWKFTGPIPRPRVELGLRQGWDDASAVPPVAGNSFEPVYFVRDNGVGFEPTSAERLFGAFQRLHGEEEFPGLGIGLVTAQRIITKHGGSLRATGAPDQGATFSFTLPS